MSLTLRPSFARWLAPLAVALAAVRLSAAPATIFQVNSFTNLNYSSGFVGQVGVTTEWPAEMGRSGDTVDVGFVLSQVPPVTARHYRFRAVITSHFEQSFALEVLAGPSLDALTAVHSEFVNSARVVAATVPLERFAVGQTNWIRLRGVGVEVGEAKPAGVQWNRWLLTRTDAALDLQSAVDDQLRRLADYVRDAIQPSGLVRDSLMHSPAAQPIHPASPDAAGFALLALCGLDHLKVVGDAEARVQAILSAHAGRTTGVTPKRNARGHWWHWLNVATGNPHPGWNDNYTTIGSALLVAGGLFARNHFPQNPTIAALAEELRASCDFDGMIHSALDGRVALATDVNGNAVGHTRPWNEYQLIVSLALRQPGATRAAAVSNLWLNPAAAPKSVYRGIPVLTDRAGSFAPAFWTQQQFFFNPDFAGNADFVGFFRNQQRADALYCASGLRQNYRYGLTAGVDPSGYRADRIGDHDNVFSPSAVGGWGDLDTLLEFIQSQPPGADPRSRYGLARVSSAMANWWPADAGLVDHLFLLFGLVEARSPGFFKQRQSFTVAPKLALQPPEPGAGRATLSWSPEVPGFELQESSSLTPPLWQHVATGETNGSTVELAGPAKFYRLVRP
ncbi:MAG: hypothetical protein IPM17_19140 [Verrucomicrobia bacterium]|nr:hypothetical protein [Verrucomicrobiota bacterium]